MTLQSLSGVDAGFLAAERPGNLLHMMGLLVLDPDTIPGGYSFEHFRSFLEERLPLLPPLRRRLVEVPGGLAPPYWVETKIELDSHLHRAAVPSPGGPHELAAMAAEMDERPLDRSRPLWEMVLVEGLSDGKIALLAKLHHASMDGMAGMKLMASLFSGTPESPPPPRQTRPESVDSIPGTVELLARAVPWLMTQPIRVARAGFETARSVLRDGLAGEAESTAPPVVPARTWLNAPGSAFRSVAYTVLPLAALREAGNPVDATVNDVLLAVIAGALRRYLEERGVLPPEPLVAAVPLAVRREDDDRSNAVTSVSVSLATDEHDPGTRLCAIRDAMTDRKSRRGNTLGDQLIAWAEVPPPFVFSLVTRAYIDLGLAQRMDPLCNLVVSSVPGPPTSLYLGGARLLGIYPLGPIYTGMLLNITAIGYSDDLHVGIVGCGKRMPDLWDLADAIPAALDELLASSRTPDTGQIRN